MNMRRFLAAMLAVVMLIAMVPAKAQAAEDDTVYESGKLYLDKTATLEDDGTYTIRMEAFATGSPVTTTTITGTPLDVVLVIDQSGSIYNDGYCEEIEEAVKSFINQLAENGKKIGKTHRVAVAGFACSEWEVTVTQSIGQLDPNDFEGSLPLADGSYAQLWTNTGIFLTDGTFKSYQTFEFEELPAPAAVLTRTNMPVGSYRNAADWVDVVGFYTKDGKQIQVKVTTKTEQNWWWETTTYTFHFQTADDTALDSLTLTTEYPNNASVNNKETYKYVANDNRMPASGDSNYYVTYGTYKHPVNGGSDESRKFPLYFVDDTTSWPGKTVRRAIYRHTDNKFYYDFRGYDRLSGSKLDSVEVDLTNKTVYKIKYDYNTETGEFNGGYLTEADYKNTFMNVTDGTAGSGNVTAALNQIASGLGASGATRTGTGMEMARKILEHNPLTEEDKAEGRERVVVVFTDGLPGQSAFEIEEANAAMVESAKIKDMDGTNEKVTVYALGLFKQNVVNAQKTDIFMNGLSSNYPDAVKMEDVSPYIKKNLTLPTTTTDRPTSWTTVEDYYVYVNGEMEPLQWVYSSSRWSFRSAITQTAMNFGSYNNNSTVVRDQETYTFGDTYTETGNPHTKDGKFYSKTADIDELMSLFPTIVTESTSTTMNSVKLKTGSILRDIMGAGFLLTGETDIDVKTQKGEWASTDSTNTKGRITWDENGFEDFAFKHVDDPKTLTKPDINDRIQIYNTNPGPNNDNVGGNFYETATGDLNLAAPPTIDITGFDYESQYLAFDHPGKRVLVTITGVEAQPDKVAYDKNNATNHQQSGLWSPMKEDRTRELVGNFPMPNTTFTEALYVLDYAKPMTLNPDDLKMSVVKSLDIDGMNGFNPAVTSITEGNGIVTVENGKYVYRPTTTAWNGYDTFYVFGDTADAGVLGYSANDVLDNLWSRVKVLPANNVYYEDTFIQSQNGVTVGIVYDGEWSYAEEGSNKELPESGETNYGESPVYNEDMPFGGVHGWEDYLQDDHGYSDGSATTSNAAGATATFTFTGTGVDIYSYTDMKQGAVMASIYRGDRLPTQEELDAAQKEDATLEERMKVKALYSVIMDNFSLSDEYFQIPTLSLHEKYVRDEAGKNVKDENGNNVLEELGFGTYTVKLTVVPKTDDADGDGTKTTRYTYTLDGIRIYNPIQNLEGDETVQKAYGEEELNASFVEVRDILLDQTSIDANDGMLGGVVFLDQVPHSDPNYGSEDDQTGLPSDNYDDTVGVYTCYGPKNEVYLASGQSIAFIPKEGMHYYVGLKSPTGETVCVSIMKDGVEQLLKLDHTTDLYYEITPEEGIVLIGNLGMETRKDENGEIVKDENGEDVYDIYDNLLSVTKIKVTGPDGNEVETADFFEPVDQPTVLRMVRTLREEAAAEPEIPEDTEPTEPTGPEVDIENPTEPSEPEVPGEEDKDDDDYLWKVIGGIFDLIRGIIFG